MPLHTERAEGAVNAGRRGAGLALLVLCGLALLPRPAQAQLGIYDALARRFSDVSFFATTGGLHPRGGSLADTRLTAFGIEVLLEIGGVSRPVGAPPARADSVTLVWTGMQVVVGEASTDTIRTYEVRPVTVRSRTEPVWTFELGLGYGQLTGFRLADPAYDMRGAVRDLPSVSLYAVYDPIGAYFGVRSGFMRFQGLQVFDDEGRVFAGEAESFLAGVALGGFLEVLSLSLFAEASYSWREFPSIRWTGPAPLPAGVPRHMALNGWSAGGGIQFSVGRN
jgi:hypothetical protein